MKSLFLMLFVFAFTAKAEVFKCLALSGTVKYQEIPCVSGEHQKSLDIILFDAERQALATKRLNEVESEYAAMKERKAKEHKEELELMRKQLEIQTLAGQLRNLQATTMKPPQNYVPQTQYWGYPTAIYHHQYPVVNTQNNPLASFHGPMHHHKRENARK
jgi:hypothetical protein